MLLNKNIYLDRKTSFFIKKLQGEVNIEEESTQLPCFLCQTEEFKVISEKDRYGLFYPTGICLNCGHLQQTSYLNSESLNKFYEKHYRDIYKTGNPEELFLSQYFEAAKKIHSFIGDINIKNILEVGSGPGGILKYFEDKKNSNVLGIDLDQRYLDYGIKNNLNLINSTVESFSSNNKYDLIIVCHVLEHLKNPISLLEELKSLLNKDGTIYIEVPSLESVKDGAYGKNLQNYLHLAHVSHFTEKSIKDLINISGYKILNFNDSIQVLIQKTSQTTKNLNNIQSNSYKYTEGLIEEINNDKQKKVGFKNLYLLTLFLYRRLKFKDFLNFIKTKKYKFSYYLSR
tara:strand:- start:4256 stop:5284 length:1029 start_codon:yes stop_codon:yes gene_type:complete